MRTSPKVVLSAIGVAVLLASPAMAKAVPHHHVASPIVCIPNDTHGSNRTCRFPASGSRTGFTAWHAPGQLGAGVSVAPHGYGSFDNPVNPPCHEAFGFCR
jgi:hypothetical protein